MNKKLLIGIGITVVIVAILVGTFIIHVYKPTPTREQLIQRSSEFKVPSDEKKALGYDVTEAEALVRQAKHAYDKGDYKKANILLDNAFEALEKAKISTVPVEVKVETICTDGIDNDGDGLIDNEDGDCWIREGATFCEELVTKTNTFNELTDIVPILKDTGINLIELVSIWEPCNFRSPGLRWEIRDYTKLDSARGTEGELFNFLNNAHAEELKVITMFETATTAPPAPPIHRERIAPWGSLNYDKEGIGGYLYQYQIANEEKDILIKGLNGEYIYDFGGVGLVVNVASDDVINIFLELYEREINMRGFDGLRIDHPGVSYCFKGETVWRGCEQHSCPDPAVTGDYSPLRLYLSLRQIKKPDQIFTSESPLTKPFISNWACNYPYYPPFTDMDEVAEISEDYPFCKILRNHVITSSISSDEFVQWLNNEPITYDRARYRMWRNWNMFDHSTINFILNDLRYPPLVILLCTIPDVPKVSQFEIIEEPPSRMLDELNISEITYHCEDRRAHWKKVLNVRNDNNALKYGTISNVWESGDSTYAYLRSYEDNKVVVVINFQDKTTSSTLNLAFESGITLHDELNDESFIVTEPSNFKITLPAYGSRILVLERGGD